MKTYEVIGRQEVKVIFKAEDVETARDLWKQFCRERFGEWEVAPLEDAAYSVRLVGAPV